MVACVCPQNLALSQVVLASATITSPAFSARGTEAIAGMTSVPFSEKDLKTGAPSAFAIGTCFWSSSRLVGVGVVGQRSFVDIIVRGVSIGVTVASRWNPTSRGFRERTCLRAGMFEAVVPLIEKLEAKKGNFAMTVSWML